MAFMEDYNKFEDEYWLRHMMRRFRQDIWISQVELAATVGVSQSTISRIEAGYGNPRYKTLMQVAKAFDKRIDFVDYDKRERPVLGWW